MIISQNEVDVYDELNSNDDDDDTISVNTSSSDGKFRIRELALCNNCRHTCASGCYSDQCECFQAKQFCEHATGTQSQFAACIGRPDLHPRPELRVSISQAKDVGHGLYCVEGQCIRKGTVIGPYVGKVVAEAEVEAAFAEVGNKPEKHLYYLKVGSKYIDGQYGGQERYINYTCHDASRNVEFQKWSTSEDSRTDVVYAVATENIEDEMWADYGWPCTIVSNKTKGGGNKKKVAKKALEGKIQCRCMKRVDCTAGRVYLF